MTLADLQWSYNGLVFGADTDYHVNKADGFEGFDTRVSDADQPRGHGGIRGLDYVATRTISFELALMEPDTDGSVYEALYADVRAAFAPSQSTDLPLVFKRPGQPERQIMCRPIQLLRSEKFTSYNRVGFPPVVLRAVDPRIYSTELNSGTVPVYSASGGGADFAIDFAGDFGTTTSTEFVAMNGGTDNAYPLVRFYGPKTGTCTGVTLTNTTTGQVVTISTTMTTGQVLTLDNTAAVTGADTSIVDLSGSSRYGSWALPREPFALAPGSNTVRFQVTGTSTDAICDLQWRDTSMH